MEPKIYDRRYWDNRAGLEKLRAVLDDKDWAGRKNRYIHIIQRMALGEWYGGGERVLDLGCGAGRLTGWLGEKAALTVGVEISEGMLRAIRSRGEGRPLVLYDGGRLPFRDETFSAVVAVGVLQDLYDEEAYQGLLGEAARCLRPGGRLFLIEQVSDGAKQPWRNVQQVGRACERAGFSMERRRPVRKGRWWMLYLIRYGLIPFSLLEGIARWELRMRRNEPDFIPYYMDYLFELRKEERSS